MTTEHLFSTHLPDFMKMDLGMGSQTAHPLPLALDAWLSAKSHRHAVEAFCAQSGLGSERTELRELSTHGFRVNALSEVQRNTFYQELRALLAQRLQVGSLERLATLYFGEAKVRRGHPYQKQTLTASARLPLRLSETDDANTVLFVEAQMEISEALATEFLHNAQILVPPNFRVKLSGPRVEMNARLNVIALVPNTRMKGWKL